jgi:hypothetical protein
MSGITNGNLSGLISLRVGLKYRYLDSCTSLAHTVLKLLEQFSQDRRLYVKSKRQRLKRNHGVGQDSESESEDEQSTNKKVAEKAFHFSAFESVRFELDVTYIRDS